MTRRSVRYWYWRAVYSVYFYVRRVLPLDIKIGALFVRNVLTRVF